MSCLLVLCRNLMSGANKMLVFQQELRKMQSSCLRSRTALILQSGFNTLYRRFIAMIQWWRKTSDSSFIYLVTDASWRKRPNSTSKWQKETFQVGWFINDVFLKFSCTTRCVNFVVNLSCNASDEETEGLFLVDFTQKIIDKKRETLAKKETDRDAEERHNLSPVPPPQNPDDEW